MVFCDIRNNHGPGKFYQLFLLRSHQTHHCIEQSETFLFGIMHCADNLQISQLSSSSYLTYLWVALISKLCSMFLANEKTDSEHHV